MTRTGPYFRHLNDEHRLDIVEHLIPIAADAGMSLTHMAIAFVLAHSGGHRRAPWPTHPGKLDDLLVGTAVTLSDDVLDRIDAVVPPGAGVERLNVGYDPPALTTPHSRRRLRNERTAA